MKTRWINAAMGKTGIVALALLLGSAVALAQSTVTLVAGPTSTTLPDGQPVPMWGYTCGDATVKPPALAASAPSVGASCTAANGSVQTGTSWQPPLITVPAGQSLTITLVNSLSFPAGTGTNTVPTSLVIVGQLGGGLGDKLQRTTMASPLHGPQGTTWPGTLGGTDSSATAITVTNGGTGYTTSSQVTILGGSGTGATAAITSVDPGTGAITGVTVTNGGTGYMSAPTVSFFGGTGAIANVNLTALQSAGTPTFNPPAQEARVRSFATEVVAGASASLCWGSTCSGISRKANLRPGTYLIESGTQPSIQGAMGLYGVLVVTDNDTTTTPATPRAYGQTFDKDVALLLSEIDPVQNAAVAAAVGTAGFSDTLVWSGQPGACGDETVHTCYPPAVNYSPLYYLINGVAFDRTSPTLSSLTVPTAATQGKLLLRLVNAGLRMHVPNVVGAPMTLLAEDGNKLPGLARVQNSVFLAPGKTYDVTIQPSQVTPATTPATYADATFAVFDRQLSLSTANQRDGGMQAYINVGIGAASGTAGSASASTTLSASDKTYYCTAGTPLAVTDRARGLLGGSVGANGVVLDTTALTGDFVPPTTLALQSNGTFTYTPSAAATTAGSCGGSFRFLVNGSTTVTATATITQCDASTPSCAGLAAAPSAADVTFTSNVASRFASPPPGVLGSNVNNPGGLALSAVLGTAVTGGTVTLNADGSFTAVPSVTTGTTMTFQFQAKNTQGTTSSLATATVVFLPASGLTVAIKDAKTGVAISDYRWIIEEDRTFWINPACQVNSTTLPPGCPAGTPGPWSTPPTPIESLGYNFHTANMPVIAQGCMGTVSCESQQTLGGTPAVCDIGNGICRTDAAQKTPLNPGAVHLDPNKRYFISVLPGDGVNPTIGGAGGPDANGKPFSIAAVCGRYDGPTGPWEPAGASAMCGHEMGGAQISPAQVASAGTIPINISLQQTPLPTAKIAVFVFQDDNPLNGENDAGGGVDVIAPNEPGLGGFEIKLFDQAGGLGDNTGQITYDMFNQPVSNSLAGKIDPISGLDACPITVRKDGLVGMIPTCPKYQADGKTPSPLAGQAVIANLYPGLYEIQAYPAADRVARGEQWLQTNTLDGGKPHEAFIKPNEPGYFQEFGPGGFHVAIGFANPAIINARKGTNGDGLNKVCSNQPCNSILNVQVSNNHMSRTPDQRTYSTETYDHYSFTQCYVAVGPADAEDFAIQACDADGKAHFEGMPNGVFKISVFDQWNDIMLDGLVGTVTINGTTDQKFPVTQWRTNLFTRTFIDTNGDGVSQDAEPGLALVNTNIRYRDGSYGFFNNTDLNGYAGFNEVFPFMNWLVVETSSTRFKPTGVHTVYDAGGPVDGSSAAGSWDSNIAHNIANTKERVNLPAELRVPGARYCADADCTTAGSFTPNANNKPGTGSSGTVFPPQAWGNTQAWQGLLGQNSFIEFGVKPFKAGENGGIHGNVIYASTRPFDDPSLSLQLQWEPGVPRVKINLYSKTVDASGNQSLTLVDSTLSTSFDDWAQGFRRDANGDLIVRSDGSYIPNMNCPGQDATSPFFQTLKNSKQWLDTPDVSGNKKSLAYNSQFKCYDGWSQLNQVQPAPYDGMYKFPSVTAVGANGKPSKTNCSTCAINPDDGNPMLPAGKYVVEVVVPPGYELVKEEDKNILLGDVYIAPVTQQFAGFGNIFIMPDQAAVNSAYNANNPGGLNKTNNLGANPRNEGDTGSIETFWPCVGAERIVPDLNSLFPQAGQAAPFAGAKRRLCDRKEVALNDQAAVLAKFYVFSSTHIAGHFSGTMTNDFAAEFDPFSPQFGEKFGPPNLPVGLRDFNGNEVARVYADQWGLYNGLYFSSWSVNPPNPTGYAPQMSIACMNDPGPIPDPAHPGQMITDPAYSPAYSNFCYETPFMPGFTAYMDTPVIPTQAFADGYNLPDSEYPDGTPAILKVTSSAAQGPWVMVPAKTPAKATFTLAAVSNGDSLSSVQVGTTTLTSGTITCNLVNILCSIALNQAQRNELIAGEVALSINNRTGTTGYTASASGATVTVTAPPTTGAELNGTAVTVSQTGITVTGTLALAGGTTTGTTSLGLTITALGDKVVQNPNFAGPNATTAPYNQKTITRHYGFGDRPADCPATGACPSVTVGGVAMNNVATWTDTTIVGDFPTTGVPACTVQQRNAPASQCGELVITAANGKRSIDAITVTAGGSAPWIVTANDFATNTGGTVTPPSGKSVKDYTTNLGRMFFSPLQTAIDSADPGDLILVQPGTYRENLLMWKPVRLQGVGAASVTLNADAHPAGKMDAWRRQVVCAFGLDLDGRPNLNNAKFDSSGVYSCPDAMFLKSDRIPFEAITGWDASGNGNLAQVLQEPTLMGAYEGAGITVLGRGVRIPGTSSDFWGADPAAAGAWVDGSVYLSAADCSGTPADKNRDYATSNYNCNPSRIDGVSVINSSQGGGGLFVHGWGHNLEVANTRIWGNHGTLAGGINVGNGETPPVFLNDGTSCGAGTTALCPPIPAGTPTNAAIPFGFNTHVRIHHNMIYNNASIGDALFTGTPAGAGGITVSAGGDNYQIDHNWIAANLSTGDGGGLQTLGVTFNGRINNNYVLFNQTTNPTLPTNGGGIVIQGANEPRTINGAECGAATDFDCPPGLGDGIGAGLVIDGNLILGNSAESGSGGGLRLQQINGSEMIAFPLQNSQWYAVTVSNNIIANNVAGWDGGGVSMEDALKVNFVNNTVASNDTTASAGALFKTLGAVNASSPPPGCTNNPAQNSNLTCPTDGAPHAPQPAGLVTQAHTPNLLEAIGNLPTVLGVKVLCPIPSGQNYGYTGTLGVNGDCMKVSKPLMINDMFWHNRAFSVDVVDPSGAIVSGTAANPTGQGLLSQQNLIAVAPMLNQTKTGECVSPSNAPSTFYYDVGLRTDDVAGGLISFTANKLTTYNSIVSGNPQNVLTQNSPVAAGTSPVLAEYCNGARVAPEKGDAFAGYNAPPGASESTSTATVFVFNGIKPSATVDEGHNWLNLTYGPLTLNRSAVQSGNTNAPELMIASASVGVAGGAYSIPALSPAVGKGIVVSGLTPTTDYFGQTRSTTAPAVGAVERLGAPIAGVTASLAFGNVTVGATPTQNLTLSNTGNATLTGINVGAMPSGFTRSGGTCVATLNAGSTCTITVQFAPTAVASYTGTVAITGNVTVTGSPVSLSGTGQVVAPTLTSITPNNGYAGTTVGVTLVGTNLGGASAVTMTPAGVTCSITGTPTATSVAASCAIGATAATGARAVSVTTPGGTSGTVTFTVATPLTLPTIALLDDFNRANANNLGTSWSQATLGGFAAIRVNGNQASDPALAGQAIWNVPAAVFGTKQGAGFTFANATLNNAALMLKATLGITSAPASFIRVLYNAGTVTVATTTNSGGAYTTLGTFAAAFVNGNTLSAVANVDGSVDVWQNATYLGRTPTSTFTGNGRIGMQLPVGGRVDNFSGATF